MDYEVEVLSIQRMIDAITGHPVWQVFFGKPNKVTDEIRDRLPDEQQNLAEAYSSLISMWIPFDMGHLYSVGSRWKVRISSKGDIQVSQVGKQK